MKPQQTVTAARQSRRARGSRGPRNLLCQLPDELCLQIVQNLTVVDIHILKRTCRHLMRLCRDSTLEVKYSIPNDAAQLEDHQRLRYIETAQLRQTLRRGHLCAGCKTLREDPELDLRAWENAQRMLWCSGCRCFHPALLYSYREREKPPKIRVCIGRQGRVRLCRHKTFSWAEIQRSGQVTCVHEDHRTETSMWNMGRHTYRAPKNVAWHQYARHLRHKGEIEIITRSFVSAHGRGEDDAAGAVTEAVRANEVYRCPHSAGPKSQLLKLAPKEFRPVEQLPFWDWPMLGYHQVADKTEDGAARARMGTETIFCNVGSCGMTASSRVLACDAPPAATLELSLISQTILEASTPCSPAWLDALDPKSYLSDEDELTRGILWCGDPDCPTSFRGVARHNIFHNSGPLASQERRRSPCYFPRWTPETSHRPARSSKRVSAAGHHARR